MRRVFLSYRRDDSKYLTGFIYQHLEDPDAFGPGSVFLDIDDIHDGIDFRDVIDEAVGRCEFFLTVIGPRWVSPRMMDANDFVRLEIEAALRRKIPVTPVLVDGATMPREDELPPSLHPLRFKHARTIRHGKDFKADVLQMVAGLHTAKKWLADRAAASGLPPVPVAPSGRRDDAAVVAGERRDVSPPVLKAGDRMEILLPGNVPMTFAYCPPGTFLMGSPDGEKDRQDNEQQHSVTLTKGFFAGIHQVTQAQWQAVMGTNPSYFKGDTLPVEQVSWDDAQAFCAKVKEKPWHAVRLPTEAEWEYAARGGTTTPFHFGSVLNGTQANCNGSYPYGTKTTGPYMQTTTPVGNYAAKFPHPWGLTDVIGNVWEWCADWHDEGNYVGSPKDDPRGPESGSYRVSRGGRWSSNAGYCRAASRSRFTPGDWLNFLGFRLVTAPSGPPG